jgi:hypothetical protein
MDNPESTAWSGSFYQKPLSGKVLPFLLREKIRRHNLRQHETQPEPLDTGETFTDIAPNDKPHPFVYFPERLNAEHSHRIFTSEELETNLQLLSQKAAMVQRQIQLGEEVYLEETSAHGNLFVGWKEIIDLRDLASGTSQTTGVSTTKRMPNEYRWFSNSANATSTTASIKNKPYNASAAVANKLHGMPQPFATECTPVTILKVSINDDTTSTSIKVNEQEAAVAVETIEATLDPNIKDTANGPAADAAAAASDSGGNPRRDESEQAPDAVNETAVPKRKAPASETLAQRRPKRKRK